MMKSLLQTILRLWIFTLFSTCLSDKKTTENSISHSSHRILSSGISLSSSSSSSTPLCSQQESIRFFDEQEQRYRRPSMLYTFPGSGNNWLEMLVERASGIHIGSVYRDLYLIRTTFPGYGRCDRSVSLVLLHTLFHSHREFEKQVLPDVCLESNITRFHRVVMLIRNPFDAIWSEFQREHSDKKNHTGVISHDRFDQAVWRRRSGRLGSFYKGMLQSEYPGIERMYGKGNYMYVRYEDLLQAELREGILTKLIAFLGLTSSPERIKCAFSLSDSPRVSRRNRVTEPCFV